MVRNTCPNCGAVMSDRSQKFCTQCGTRLPDLPPALLTGRLAATGAAAAAVIIVIIVAGALSSPLLREMAGNAAGKPSGPVMPVSATAGITPLPPEPLPITTAVSSTATPLSTTVPVTASPVTTQTTRIPATTPKTTQTTATTVPTATPTPAFTAQITLAVTWIPSQPSPDTYTSKTEGAPFIDPSSLEARIHDLINNERRQNGLSTLSYDSFLASIARGHSYDMTLRNFFEHTNPDGLDARARGEWAGYPCVRDYETYYTEGISENIAMVYRYDTYKDLIAPNGTVMQTEYQWSTEEFIANKVVNGWMNSEGHRNNILDYHFQQEGIGVAFASDNAIYVTENFC
ncbi:CAP domain-containing protein [Methanoregula formicica]|nr:CAP domain-containing protein [Methanoregula formicica]